MVWLSPGFLNFIPLLIRQICWVNLKNINDKHSSGILLFSFSFAFLGKYHKIKLRVDKSGIRSLIDNLFENWLSHRRFLCRFFTELLVITFLPTLVSSNIRLARAPIPTTHRKRSFIIYRKLLVLLVKSPSRYRRICLLKKKNTILVIKPRWFKPSPLQVCHINLLALHYISNMNNQ